MKKLLTLYKNEEANIRLISGKKLLENQSYGFNPGKLF